jgi:hypothetical protein
VVAVLEVGEPVSSCVVEVGSYAVDWLLQFELVCIGLQSGRGVVVGFEETSWVVEVWLLQVELVCICMQT